MLIYEILNEQSAEGLDFKYHEDTEVERDPQSAWRVDRIDAYDGGEKVGYIKVSYIPKERFNEKFPTIFHWLSNQQGKRVLPYAYRNVANIRDIPVDVLRDESLFSLWNEVEGYPDYETQKSWKTLPDKEVRDLWMKLAKKLEKKYKSKFDQFKGFHVDKPLVDYISVEQDYRRKGIGTALHRAAHDWMKKRGMRLYASGTQTPEAKATWAAHEKRFPVGQEQTQVHDKPVTRRFFAD